MNILSVALGGALGATCRYGLAQLPLESTFPVATFFTFSLEAVQLLKNKNYGIGFAYMAMSVLCCVLGVVIGQCLARKIM